MPTHSVTVPAHGQVDVTVADVGQGRPILLLHGGAGPRSVASFAQLLSAQGNFRVLSPTHPGFDGTPRPDWLTTIGGLAEVYDKLLNQLQLSGVTVIGSSIGGGIAAELAIRGSPRVSGTVLADAVGISVEGHPVADAFSLTLDQLTDLSYHNPAKFRIDLSSFTDAQRQAMGANRAALAVYGAKTSLPDPTLLGRLHGVRVPVLVVWGESDRVADPEYGRAFAAAIPGGRFQLLSGTGHMPMLETPDQLLAAIRTFTDTYR
jgi:pimeloyl-ACP methyl ester carboxylesterase